VNANVTRLLSAGMHLWADGPVADLATLIREGGVTGAVRDAAAVARRLPGGAAGAAGAAGLPDAEGAVVADARAAADLLLPVHSASGGADGFVSADLGPDLANDTAATVAGAARLVDLVGRPNVLVKVPATDAGVAAITELVAAGIGVQPTLVFGLARHRAVLEAVRTGLDRDAAPVAAKAMLSFSLSEIDTEADKRLWKIGTDRSAALRGRLGLATARLAYESFASHESHGRVPGPRPRQMWTSTRARDPYYSDTLYVDGLVAPDVVNALQQTTLDFLHEGSEFDGRLIPDFYADAHAVVAEFTAVGVDVDDVVAVLEDKGLRRLEAAWRTLCAVVEAPRVPAPS
jgi:transaldolase